VTARALRLLVFDRHASGPLGSLPRVWALGAKLFRARGAFDRAFGCRGWEEALEQLEGVDPSRPIAEVQFWGHGKWGDARFGNDRFDESCLLRGHPLGNRLARIARRATPDGLFWFRCCETFGADAGQSFARAFSDTTGLRVAGHTYVIAALQSGLHTLAPGARPDWDPAEGLARGTPARPLAALMSTPSAPRTITFLEARLPAWA